MITTIAERFGSLRRVERISLHQVDAVGFDLATKVFALGMYTPLDDGSLLDFGTSGAVAWLDADGKVNNDGLKQMLTKIGAAFAAWVEKHPKA